MVVRCGLRLGLALDRDRLREVAVELRNARALGKATRALRARPMSRRRLRERLEAHGVAEGARSFALDKLSAAGLVDDGSLARGRALALAERGWGNAAIRARLAAEGLSESDLQAAVAELDPEADRAVRLVDAAGDRRRAWSKLHRRGFDPDTIESALGPLDDGTFHGLG